MNDKIAIAFIYGVSISRGTGSASDQSPVFVVWLRSEGQAARICVVLLIYPGSPGPNHKLINIHSFRCINSAREYDHNDLAENM